MINNVGVVFKGSGFYVTDNRGKNSASPSANGTTKEGADKGAETTSADGAKKDVKGEASAEKPKADSASSKKKSAETTS